MPAIDGAVSACHARHDAGHDLVCVTALEDGHQRGRLRNLRYLGYPVERVVATGKANHTFSPKAEALANLCPEVFVDDYLPYFADIPSGIHGALILRVKSGSPNSGPGLETVHPTHGSLADFARLWLARPDTSHERH